MAPALGGRGPIATALRARAHVQAERAMSHWHRISIPPRTY
jgi:hypothetical protein